MDAARQQRRSDLTPKVANLSAQRRLGIAEPKLSGLARERIMHRDEWRSRHARMEQARVAGSVIPQPTMPIPTLMRFPSPPRVRHAIRPVASASLAIA